jgi:hypothetical protein
MPTWRVLQGCPCPASIAPYFALLADDCRKRGWPVTFNSINRSDAAAPILHRYGKRTQREIHADPTLAAISNPPGFSSHELRSDGNAIYHTPRGQLLPEWQQGIDVNDRDVPHMIAAAKARGWVLARPYASGAEYHHLVFARQPRPKGPKTMAKLIHLRATLPRS